MEPFAAHLAEVAMLRGLRHSLASWLEEAGAPAEAKDSIVLATHEAVTNALTHGDVGSPVTVTANRHADGRFMIVVRNDGAWKEPTPDAGGRGLPMMRDLMSDVGIRPATAVYMRKDV
jgi:anti-sigma regulatory factor (Ser/Thr protein kinase)